MQIWPQSVITAWACSSEVTIQHFPVIKLTRCFREDFTVNAVIHLNAAGSVIGSTRMISARGPRGNHLWVEVWRLKRASDRSDSWLRSVHIICLLLCDAYILSFKTCLSKSIKNLLQMWKKDLG